jgi:hypothetical protein
LKGGRIEYVAEVAARTLEKLFKLLRSLHVGSRHGLNAGRKWSNAIVL